MELSPSSCCWADSVEAFDGVALRASVSTVALSDLMLPLLRFVYVRPISLLFHFLSGLLLATISDNPQDIAEVLPRRYLKLSSNIGCCAVVVSSPSVLGSRSQPPTSILHRSSAHNSLSPRLHSAAAVLFPSCSSSTASTSSCSDTLSYYRHTRS